MNCKVCLIEIEAEEFCNRCSGIINRVINSGSICEFQSIEFDGPTVVLRKNESEAEYQLIKYNRDVDLHNKKKLEVMGEEPRSLYKMAQLAKENNELENRGKFLSVIAASILKDRQELREPLNIKEYEYKGE